jgi:hypothetical protein
MIITDPHETLPSKTRLGKTARRATTNSEFLRKRMRQDARQPLDVPRCPLPTARCRVFAMLRTPWRKHGEGAAPIAQPDTVVMCRRSSPCNHHTIDQNGAASGSAIGSGSCVNRNPCFVTHVSPRPLSDSSTRHPPWVLAR